jgi:membrane dipeptidase
MKLLPCLALLSLSLAAQTPEATKAKALKLHQTLFTVDTHCDTPMRLGGEWNIGEKHELGTRNAGLQDFPRMKEGGLSSSFFAVFVGQGPRTDEGHAKAREKAVTMFDNLDKMFVVHRAVAERALTVADGQRIFKTGKRAIFLGLENGYPVGHDLANVDYFFGRGARYITLAHTSDNDLCDSANDRNHTQDSGLSPLGAQVVARANKLGMMVDVSHISEKSFYDVLKVAKAPIIASHSCARAVCDNPRNLTNDQLQALKKNGGVVQLCILSDYIKAIPRDPERTRLQQDLRARMRAAGGRGNIKDPVLAAALDKEASELDAKYPLERATVKDAVDHIDHIVKTIGIDYVGIGTDFDGGGGLKDCRDVSELPAFTVELVKRGYSDKDIAKIWGGNAMRVLGACEKAAAKKN